MAKVGLEPGLTLDAALEAASLVEAEPAAASSCRVVLCDTRRVASLGLSHVQRHRRARELAPRERYLG